MAQFKQYQALRLILGDQLNAAHSWFSQKDDKVLYVIAELHQEQHYVRHHVQKIQAFFAAMKQFADALTAAGHQVLWLSLDDTAEYQDLPSLLKALIARFNCQVFGYQQPDEYRLHLQLEQFTQAIDIPVQCVENEHFFLPFNELEQYFERKKHHTMESFYRKMRLRFNYLMVDGKPEGAQWNYDKQNREKLSKADITTLPEPLLFANDVTDINQRLKRHNINHFGHQPQHLLWPVTRSQAISLLHNFCRYCLPQFGRFQDAMTCQANDLSGDKQWSLYHSRLSFVLNAKMISPKQVVDTAIAYYRQQDEVSLAQIEGFVRQILGWREFVRGLYWRNMPEFTNLNHLQATTALPSWFWTGNTKMNCLHHAIKQSLDYGYAHHIQRLMVTGNFCLIAGIHPDEVDAWYLGIYVDAIEWVEMPNTRGMSQFADGGIVGTKAYCAGGNYINKMSDYCQSCHYNVKQKVGENACPLNSLYWHFMNRHRERLGQNPRQALVYKNWDRQADAQKQQILAHAEQSLKRIESL